MFRSILIANRGEIAVRIIRACRNMGIKSIAVYSKEDKDSLHVQLADRRVCIGEGPAKNSYLNMERIISAAKNTDADAIHPGFGFLSENADFVRLCKENDIAFIGPSAEVIDSMGNKSNARKTMMEAGVPVVPGTKEPVYDAVTGEKLADEIGYPVMIKASSGGGGKGMRVSKSKEDFEFNFNTAQRESANAFGDDTMYIEKFIENPRHVEIQIMADEHGNVVALGERDCSVQRNHQKLYPDNTTEPMNLQILPMPRAAGGKLLASQAGVGLCALKTTVQKQEAVSLFAHWLTESDRNLAFAAQTGYMPVTYDAFDAIKDYNFNNAAFESLYRTFTQVQQSAQILSEPAFAGFYGKAGSLYEALRAKQKDYAKRSAGGADTEQLSEQTWKLFQGIS